MAAAALRRDHPRPVPGRRLVGADPQHPGLAAAADAGRPPPRDGRGAGRVRQPRRRRGRRSSSTAGGTAGGPTPEPAVPADAAAPTRPARTAAGARRCARFTRSVDAAWRRTSYSSLTAVEPWPRRWPAASAASRRWRPRTTRRSRRRRRGRRDRPSRPRTRRALADGRRCRSARRSARWCTRCSSTPTRDAADLRAELLGHIDEQLVRWPVELDRDELADALVAVCDSPLGGRRPATDAARGRRCATGCARWTSSCRWPAATCAGRRGRRRTPRRPGPAAARGTCPRATRCARYADAAAPTPRSAARRCAATSPARSTWCCGSTPTARATWSSTTRPTGWAPPDEPLTAARLPARGAGRRDGRTPTTRCRRCCTPSVLHRFLRWRQPGYDPAAHLGGVLYLYLRGMCGPEHAAGRRGAVRRLRVAAAGRAGRGALRPARRGGCGRDDHDALRAGRATTTGRLVARRDRPARRASTAPACSTAADVHVAARVGRPRRRGRRAGAAGRRAGRARGPPRVGLPSTSPTVARRRARPALARRRGVGGRRRRVAAGRRRRGARSSTGCSTSTATTGWRTQVVRRPARARPPSRRRSVDEARAGRGASRGSAPAHLSDEQRARRRRGGRGSGRP